MLVTMDQNDSSISSPQQAENGSNSPPHHELAPWKFREAVDNAGHAVLFTALDSTIEYVNPAFEDTTGYEASEVIGKTPALLNSGVHDEPFYSDMWNTITSGEVWHGELVNEDAEGEEFMLNRPSHRFPVRATRVDTLQSIRISRKNEHGNENSNRSTMRPDDCWMSIRSNRLPRKSGVRRRRFLDFR